MASMAYLIMPISSQSWIRAAAFVSRMSSTLPSADNMDLQDRWAALEEIWAAAVENSLPEARGRWKSYGMELEIREAPFRQLLGRQLWCQTLRLVLLAILEKEVFRISIANMLWNRQAQKTILLMATVYCTTKPTEEVINLTKPSSTLCGQNPNRVCSKVVDRNIYFLHRSHSALTSRMSMKRQCFAPSLIVHSASLSQTTPT